VRAGIAVQLAERACRRTPPEFYVVAACCIWPNGTRRREAIRAAASGAIDWACLLRITARHGVWGLVADGLQGAGISPPTEVSREIYDRVHASARSNLVMAAESLKLARLLEEACIPTVFVKGVSLAMLAYGVLALKQSVDIDLLVAPRDVGRAADILDRAGYAGGEQLSAMTRKRRELLIRHARHWGFIHRDSRVPVELHWRLSYNPRLLQSIGISSPFQSVPLASTAIRTLATDDLITYLFVHGAQHGWCRLKWLADLTALLSLRSEGELDGIYRAARAAGAGPCAGQALLLCERLLGLRLSPRLAGKLRRSARVRFLEALALEAMLGKARPFGTKRVLLSFFLLGRGWRYLGHELFRYLISPADLTILPLPDRLTFLYPAFRLPVWMYRRTKRMMTLSG
jgi:Uncharacterised nucleotidyltransferase